MHILKNIIKISIPDDFYKEEERCGYLVSSDMKKVWAVELDLLNEFDCVCKENNLKYFISYGSLLGAIRHNGFIPWDDDIDVTMPRCDYEKLCSISQNSFRYPYFFQTEESDPGFSRPFARLRNSETTAIQKIEDNGRIPYNQGVFIDIFPLDNFPDLEEERESFKKTMESKRKKMMRFSEWGFRYRKYASKNPFTRLKTSIKGVISKPIGWYMIRFGKHNPYVKEYINCSQKYNNMATKDWCVPYLFRPGKYDACDKKWFNQTVLVPFEMLKVPAPLGYEKVLSACYGNWREYVIGNNIHGDVIYDTERSYLYYMKNYGLKK